MCVCVCAASMAGGSAANGSEDAAHASALAVVIVTPKTQTVNKPEAREVAVTPIQEENVTIPRNRMRGSPELGKI